MSYRPRKESLNTLDRKYGLNKSRNIPKFNKSLYKTTKSKFNHFAPPLDAASPTKTPTVKTLPTDYDRSPSPEIKIPAKPSVAVKQDVPQERGNHKRSVSENPEVSDYSFNYSSIEEVEMKIDVLLKQKLKLLVSLNKHKFFNKSRDLASPSSSVQTNLAHSILKLNNQLSFLISYLKTNLNNPEINCNYDKWHELDKKIKMVEKVMAENDSEVEIMRKYYTKVSHNVTTYRSFCHEPGSVIITKIKDTLGKSKEREQRSMTLTPAKSAKIPSNSISRTSYKLPNLDDYQKYRYKQTKPNFDQPIIQRSAYQTSYRPFNPQLLLPMTRKHSSLSIRPPSRNQTSSYKDEFKPMKQTPVNFKELDCYKDKFRNLKVNFQQKKAPRITEQIAQYINLQKVSSRNSLKPFESSNKIRVETMPTPRSTCHLDYGNINVKDRKICYVRPKNNRLDSLRTTFKRLITEE